MAVLKCKMCGGMLDIIENQTVCECEYCGSKQTVPHVDDEKKVKLYERANRFRMANEFDKAATVYEGIIDEDDTEAEAYWGLMLCKYGIEYVDDPATGDKVPTCHRSSFESFMDDADFEMVMSNSDSLSRVVYREQAKQIEEIRRRIIEVSGKEDPYDIFICYKETDEKGDRTIDSVMAQDVYEILTDKGYRVFFSRISLEDKLGTVYEPYIFAALNSAKIMLAFGTTYDYYNAVWVKNEWGRFLKIMASDKSKYLIPCYKNIDAYDMPKEFAHLQAQDMGKVGATQDLLRGIEKIIPRKRKSKNESMQMVQQVAINGDSYIVASLIKRVEIFLKDGEWKNAEQYCEKILDIEPENAEAYLGKLMAELKVTERENLRKYKESFEHKKSYKKAYEYGDDSIKELLDNSIKDILYNNAMSKMNSSQCANDYLEAMRVFSKVICYKNSDELAKNCKEYAEQISEQNERKYEEALAYLGLRLIPEQEKQIEEENKRHEEAFTVLQSKLTDAEISTKQKEEELITELRKKIEISETIHDAETTELQKKLDVTVSSNKALIDELEKELSHLGFLAGKKKKELTQKIEESKRIHEKEENDLREAIERNHEKYQEKVDFFEQKLKEIQEDKNTKNETLKNNEKQENDSKEKSERKRKDYHEQISVLEKNLKDCQEEENKVKQEITIENSGHLQKIKSIHSSRVDYKKAVEILQTLKEYKDAEKLLKKYIIFTAEKGDEISFGNYNWQVLAKEDNKSLLITTKRVCDKAYNKKKGSTEWESCTLRKWLNNDFYNEFTEEEKSLIAMTHLENRKIVGALSEEHDTDDKVFLLSADEVYEYFLDDNARATRSWWWLRSPVGITCVANVESDGAVREEGRLVDCAYGGVRPALWINPD